MWRRLWDPSGRFRTVLDWLWITAFAALLVSAMVGGIGQSLKGVALELVPGQHSRLLYFRDKRLALIEESVSKRKSRWIVTQRVHLANAESVATGVDDDKRVPGSSVRRPLLSLQVQLREDLSLRGFSMDADLGRLAQYMPRSMPLFQLPWAGSSPISQPRRSSANTGRVEVPLSARIRARCVSQLGSCEVTGRVGATRIHRELTTGRGPVLPSAVYRLISRGALGRQTELRIFDPLTMRPTMASYTVLGHQRLVFADGSYRTVHVEQRIGPVKSEVWLDREGRVLREQLPWGFHLEHLSWSIRDG